MSEYVYDHNFFGPEECLDDEDIDKLEKEFKARMEKIGLKVKKNHTPFKGVCFCNKEKEMERLDDEN